MNSSEKQSDFLPEIRFGKIGVLKVHQITDEELNKMEQGSSHSILLNIGISVISIAISFLISLLTTKIESDRLFIVFVLITISFFLAGIILVIIWWIQREPLKRLIQEIRNRMPPEGEAQPL